MKILSNKKFNELKNRGDNLAKSYIDMIQVIINGLKKEGQVELININSETGYVKYLINKKYILEYNQSVDYYEGIYIDYRPSTFHEFLNLKTEN